MPQNSPVKSSTLLVKTTTLAATAVLFALLPVASANANHGFHPGVPGSYVGTGLLGGAVGAIIADSTIRRAERANRLYYQLPAFSPPLPVAPYYDPYYRPYASYAYRGPYYQTPYYRAPTAYRQNRVVKPRKSVRGHVHPNKIQKKARKSGPKVITYDQAMAKPKPGYATSEPWSVGWKSYCSSKYRSFNADTGTYLGKDGRRRFCIAK